VSKVNDDLEITVEIANDIRVRVQRGLLAAVLSKTEPVNDDTAKDEGTASKLKSFLGGKRYAVKNKRRRWHPEP